MSYPASRLRFFKGQLLRSIDLSDQEGFHFEQAALHDRTVHFHGIAEGLDVAIKAGAPATVTVSPGAAVDANGHPILVSTATDVTASGVAPSHDYALVLSFQEAQSDPQPAGFTAGNTRLTQNPTFTFAASAGATDIVLATVTLDAAGNVTAVSPLSRTYAGLRLPGQGGAGFDLRAVPDGPTETKLSIEHFTQGDATIAQLVTVDATGKVGIGTATPTASLEVNGQVKITGGSPGAGKVLTSDAAGLASWQALPAALVGGPASAVPTAIAKFASTTGNALSGTGVTIDAADKLIAPALRITSGSPGANKVLTAADAAGNSAWQTTASLSIASGPATSTVNGVAAFLDATGKNLRSTTATIDAASKLTAQSARVAGPFKLADGTQAAGKILVSDAAGLASWQTSASQSLVSGPASSVDITVPTFNGTTGKLLQGTGVTIDAASKLTAASAQITSGSPAAGKILVASDAAGNAAWQTTASQSIASGPATSTTDGVSAFADATGKLLRSTTVTIDAAGKLTAPSAQVAGAFALANGTQGAGKLLSSDAAGLATWQTPSALSIATGPATSAANGITTFLDATGKTLRSTGVTIDAANKLTAASALLNGPFALVDGTQGAGKLLVSDASGNASWQTTASQSLVSGPASSADRAVPTWSGTTGKLVQATGVTIDAANKLTAASLQIDGGQISLNTGANNVVITSGTSAAARSYRVPDLGPNGLVTVLTTSGSVSTLKLEPDAAANATKAGGVLMKPSDKTAGTGDGGELVLMPGASAGGSAGKVIITSQNPINAWQTSAAGAFVELAGSSGTTPSNVSVTSFKNGAALQGFVKISVNGTAYYTPFYGAPTS